MKVQAAVLAIAAAAITGLVVVKLATVERKMIVHRYDPQWTVVPTGGGEEAVPGCKCSTHPKTVSPASEPAKPFRQGVES